LQLVDLAAHLDQAAGEGVGGILWKDILHSQQQSSRQRYSRQILVHLPVPGCHRQGLGMGEAHSGHCLIGQTQFMGRM
jgi:hypothetical protein